MRQELRKNRTNDSHRGEGVRRGSTASSSSGSFTDGSYDDDDLGSSEGEDDLSDAGFDDPTRLNDPIALGVEGVEVPPRLEVLDDRMGYWANGRETIAKYNGKYTFRSDFELECSYRAYLVDPLWLALWLFSLVAVMIGLCFVWGATDVSRAAHFRCSFSDQAIRLVISQPTPSPEPTLPEPSNRYRTPFSTLLHMIPLLAVLVLAAVAAPLGFLLLLRKTVRHVLIVSLRARPIGDALTHRNPTSGHCSRDSLPALYHLLVGFCGFIRG